MRRVLWPYLASTPFEKTTAKHSVHLACLTCAAYQAYLTHEMHYTYVLEVGPNVVLLYGIGTRACCHAHHQICETVYKSNTPIIPITTAYESIGKFNAMRSQC